MASLIAPVPYRRSSTWSPPSPRTILRQGMRDIGLTEANQILIAEQLGDSKPLVLTWNNTSLYTWCFLNLEKDGPTVIEVPPGVMAALDDIYFSYIVDIGAAGGIEERAGSTGPSAGLRRQDTQRLPRVAFANLRRMKFMRANAA